MSNQDHLDILKQGDTIWNQWREEYPETTPELSGSDLTKEKRLRWAVLSDADLYGANLSGVDLRMANLSGANLSEAVLKEADLRWANLK